ncbi:hypothetical protein N7488_006786 [Penicillium malachiteum]|nr:hypothetical protein N7488_006786 [Penicillium malachiteum]
MAFASQTIYAATKAGCEALCRCWTAALGKKYGATVNCVNPGPVATEMYWESDPEFLKSMESIIDATPAAPRVGEVADIVPLVAFLCSEESHWTTGSVLNANGGMLLI